MKGFISAATLLFITFSIAITALAISGYNAIALRERPVLVKEIPAPVVTVATPTPEVVVTATPTAAIKVLLPVKKVSPVITQGVVK